MNNRHVRVYSALLRLYPRKFQADYRREMTVLFAQQLEDARSTDGNLGVVRLWIRSLVDLIATAPTEHLEPALVAQPVVGVDQPPIEQDRAPGISSTWMIATLAPGLIAFAVTIFFAAHYMGPMFEKPPEALGMPLGTVIMGLCVLWYAIGVAIGGVARRPRIRLLALLVFVFPATIGYFLGPALILILQNLKA